MWSFLATLRALTAGRREGRRAMPQPSRSHADVMGDAISVHLNGGSTGGGPDGAPQVASESQPRAADIRFAVAEAPLGDGIAAEAVRGAAPLLPDVVILDPQVADDRATAQGWAALAWDRVPFEPGSSPRVFRVTTTGHVFRLDQNGSSHLVWDRVPGAFGRDNTALLLRRARRRRVTTILGRRVRVIP